MNVKKVMKRMTGVILSLTMIMGSFSVQAADSSVNTTDTAVLSEQEAENPAESGQEILIESEDSQAEETVEPAGETGDQSVADKQEETGETDSDIDVQEPVKNTENQTDTASESEAVSEESEAAEVPQVQAEETEEVSTPHIFYQSQVQTDGWQDEVQDGATSGTVGEYKRMETLKIRLEDQSYKGSVEYRSHVQNLGWESAWAKDGAASGTVGKGLRLEAVQIRLTGEMAQHYDIYYRVHAQEFGWLGWAKNGESAGTAAFSYRLEGIQIVLVEKGGQAPGSTADAFWQRPSVYYQSHVQSIGWQKEVKNGGISGTVGQYKRMESVKLRLTDQAYSGNIEYRSHIQNLGWESSWKANGAMSGTTAKALRLEAIQIRLTGEMAQRFDVYYRVHAEQFGWLGWAKNGESAGTAGFGYRLEGLQVVLVVKGKAAPGSTASAFHQLPSVYYQTHVQNDGWKSEVKDGGTGGTVGQYKRMESIKIRLANQDISGNIEYRSHIQNLGWESSWKKNGALSGTTGKSLRLEAIQIRLTGNMAKYFDIYYRVHAQQYGWLGWAKNGASAGTEGCSYRLEAVQIRLVKKGAAAPGSTSRPFVKSKNGWYYENGYKYYYKSGVRQTDIRNIIGKQSSYLIKINKQMSCVTVYAKDGSRGYIIPVVAFACSPGAGTPTGTFHTSDKYRWHALYGAQGQWCTRITGHILFHSLPYTHFNNRTMMPNQYNRLGTWASSGCIRLRAIDAKWIYDNCASGTTVTIYNSSAAGPLGKPVYAKIPAYQNWDPTDPTI